jgi:hypothetical protein
VSISLERSLVSGRYRQAELEFVKTVFHTMRLMFAGLVTASVPYDQDRRLRMDLDIDIRVFAVSIIFSDKDGRRVELLCGEGATRHGREKSNGWQYPRRSMYRPQ